MNPTEPPAPSWDGDALRALVPRVLAGLVRRGEDFDAAEDALQEALLEAIRVWPGHPPRDARAWLTAVATRRLIDARRSAAARARREVTDQVQPVPGATENGDDTLLLLFCCCHPELAPASQMALALRAVGGLTTREIADAFTSRKRRWRNGSAGRSARCAGAGSTGPATWPSCCGCCT
jgi:predicted RNA polymerase sigma factor